MRKYWIIYASCATLILLSPVVFHQNIMEWCSNNQLYITGGILAGVSSSILTAFTLLAFNKKSFGPWLGVLALNALLFYSAHDDVGLAKAIPMLMTVLLISPLIMLIVTEISRYRYRQFEASKRQV